MINTMNDKRLKECLTVVENTLEDMKAKNITVINVEDLTDVMERIVIAEGTSKRHVRAMADSVGAEAKQADFMPLGREGGTDSDWTLIDLGAVVVHMMTPQAREFYDLEGLWSSPESLAELVATPREKKAGRRN
ncbi:MULTISPECIES: ribosome silencing factor [unclassified Psychrobacter]|jgi:ribosome-associated protein|uniref:ribosome silencing factor n=1 Tax=unclassified Psychrobacter TaxID=196806 RepID=UPI00071E7289|nr:MULTISPECIES: ribosome silencing factor [unclassified Psychrobacter]OLF37603.1 ribosome silencing factor [Psychrobacter sp. Cmf 22.2]